MKFFFKGSLCLFLCTLFLFQNANAQREEPKHLILTDDGNGNFVDGRCLLVFQHEDTLQLTVTMAVNPTIENPVLFYSNCPPMRIQIRSMYNGKIIGISDPSPNWIWSDDNQEAPCNIANDTPYYLLQGIVNVSLHLGFICSEYHNEDPPEGTLIQDVLYEIVVAEPNEDGVYEEYDVIHEACADNLFSMECFAHQHADGDPGFTEEEDEFHVHSTLCTTCEGFDSNQGGNSLIGTTSGAVAAHRAQHSHHKTESQFYPNPFKNTLYWDYHLHDATDMSVTIYGMDQKVIFEHTCRQAAGDGTIEVSTANWPVGVYLARIWDGTRYHTAKVLKTAP